ncbi:MAG TPA: glucan 1,4-alpha-glucosidase [Bacteroidia bacterium]|jgi:glucoamylase|nr:glucan 1,4-alpha-glucosidase [Bacteroidia bacterium]
MYRNEKFAFGWPGIDARWTTSAKSGVGTSLNSTSKVWYSISHGILNEIYYPQVDQACTRDLSLIVTDGKDFFSEEKRDTSHHIKHIAKGVPGYHITNSCNHHHYRIEKEIISDPSRDTLLQRIQFFPMNKKRKDFKLFMLLAPHLGNSGAGNNAWVGNYKGLPMLFAQRGDAALALACSVPWKKGSAGFVGTSDGWQDLMLHKEMAWEFERAENGNVALTGEFDMQETNGNSFVVALGFGRNTEEAGQRARASILESFESAKTQFIKEWEEWHKKLYVSDSSKKNAPKYFSISAAMLRVHESKRHPGGLIASLSIPWGFNKGDDDLGGYHLVWPRDMVQTAGGLLGAKAFKDARRVLNYLMVTQEADGHWSQNMWLDGAPYWKGIQMDQTALPIMLVDLVNRETELTEADLKLFWPMIRKAASYLVTNGPVTEQDRWEENAGYSTFTVAVEIAALLIAAEHADLNNEPQLAVYLREIADSWNSNIERWTYVTGSDLAKFVGVEGYYVRIGSKETADADYSGTDLLTISNRPKGENICPANEMVSPDALALVRFGLRAADDPRILNTIKVIDATLKLDNPLGPLWYRYNRDGYGEQVDGSPFNGTGIGRPWPLLTGERAHYEIAAGNYAYAEKLLKTLENYANETGLFPEQIWDSEDIPEYGLYLGKASGSAMPLLWAHSEYIKLCRSLKAKKIFDMPSQTQTRYLEEKTDSNIIIWNFTNQYKYIPKGKTLRLQCLASATVKWTNDNWLSCNEVQTLDSGIGIHFADIVTAGWEYDQQISYTFFWHDAESWENKNYSLSIEKKPSAQMPSEPEKNQLERDKIKIFLPS